MAKIDLTKYGITGTTEIAQSFHDALFEEETKPELEGFEKGQVSDLVPSTMTGIYDVPQRQNISLWMRTQGHSLVTSDEYKNDNHPATQEAWNAAKILSKKELSQQETFRSRWPAELTKTHVWPSVLSLRLHGRHNFVTTCSFSRQLRELENLSRISAVYNASKAVLRTTKN